MRGRKPLPTHLKVIRGTARQDRLHKNEPKPEGDLLRPPEGLTERQRICWDQVIATSPPGLLKPCDRGTVAAYVINEALVLEFNEQLASAPPMVRIGGTAEAPIMGPNPLLAVRRQHMVVMIRAAEQLGFTPSSRTRIEIAPDVVPHNEWDEIL